MIHKHARATDGDDIIGGQVVASHCGASDPLTIRSYAR